MLELQDACARTGIESHRLNNQSPNSTTRSCTCARCVWELSHQSLQPLACFPGLGTLRKKQPASCLEPAIKPLQCLLSLSQSHTLTCRFCNGLTAFQGLGASAHSSVVLAPPIGQRLGFAWLTSGTCKGTASVIHFQTNAGYAYSKNTWFLKFTRLCLRNCSLVCARSLPV